MAETTTTTADDAAKTTESTFSTTPTSESNEIVENIDNDSEAKPEADLKETTPNGSYPSFHVTYWMFYPYSQVTLFVTISILMTHSIWLLTTG